MIVIHPTESELNLAGHVGILRVIYALRAGHKRPEAMDDDAGLLHHVLGAIGEAMLAKHLGVFWSGTVGTIKAPGDVAGCYQVKATDLRFGKLIVQEQHDPWQPYVLARVRLPEVHLVGWLWGHEAKQDKFWRIDVPYPAFFAWPLHDMETLPTQDEIKAYQQSAA